MQKTITDQLKELAIARHVPEQEVMGEAIKIGVKYLYRESIFGPLFKEASVPPPCHSSRRSGKP